jgi:hypothetical protein
MPQYPSQTVAGAARYRRSKQCTNGQAADTAGGHLTTACNRRPGCKCQTKTACDELTDDAGARATSARLNGVASLGPSHQQAGRGAWIIPLLGRSALQLVENQLAMLLEYAQRPFERMEHRLSNLRGVASIQCKLDDYALAIEWRIERRSGCPSPSSDRAAMFL